MSSNNEMKKEGWIIINMKMKMTSINEIMIRWNNELMKMNINEWNKW